MDNLRLLNASVILERKTGTICGAFKITYVIWFLSCLTLRAGHFQTELLSRFSSVSVNGYAASNRMFLTNQN